MVVAVVVVFFMSGCGFCVGGWVWLFFGGGLVVVCFLLAKLQITPSKFGQNSIQSS